MYRVYCIYKSLSELSILKKNHDKHCRFKIYEKTAFILHLLKVQWQIRNDRMREQIINFHISIKNNKSFEWYITGTYKYSI